MDRVYIEAKLKDESKICSLRNEKFEEVNGLHYYKKKSPHITIVPPFYIDGDDLHELQAYINSLSFGGEKVVTNNIYAWKSVDQPEHIALDVDLDVRERKRELFDKIGTLDANLVNSPAPYHITMFSSTGHWETPPESLENNIRTTIDEFTGIDDAELKKLQIKHTR